LLLSAAALLFGCGDPEPPPYTGTTSIHFHPGPSTLPAYEQKTRERVLVTSDDGPLVFEWMGCQFETGEHDDALLPTTCDITLEDGRVVKLVVDSSAEMAIVAQRQPLVIDIITSVELNGTYYGRSYFSFEEDGNE